MTAEGRSTTARLVAGDKILVTAVKENGTAGGPDLWYSRVKRNVQVATVIELFANGGKYDVLTTYGVVEGVQPHQTMWCPIKVDQ